MGELDSKEVSAEDNDDDDDDTDDDNGETIPNTEKSRSRGTVNDVFDRCGSDVF